MHNQQDGPPVTTSLRGRPTTSATIDLDAIGRRPAPRPRRRGRALAMTLALTTVAYWWGYTAGSVPAAPERHAERLVELRLGGDGVGQVARVDELDVAPWGWTGTALDPRSVVYVVQAGVEAPAECSILVDGHEVAHAVAEPLDTATCWWAA